MKARAIAATTVLAWLALTGNAPVMASTEEAMARFAEAQAAFEAEDFSRARALFEQSLEAGMAGPAIHYNIGAAAYLGGDLPRAEKAFREVALTPSMAVLAHYNLGLVAMERHDESEARDWFERVLGEAPKGRLAELSAQRLEELPEDRPAGNWTYYSRGGFGYDDNVSLRSSSIDSPATGVSDSYGELVLAGSYSSGPWRVDTSAGLLQYMKASEFSQSGYSLGGARTFVLGAWYVELGASGAQYSLDGRAYERDVSGVAKVARSLEGGGRLRASIRASSVQGKADFTGLTGDRTELGLWYDKNWRSWTFGVHTRAERNQSEDPIFGTQWLQLGADVRYTWTPVWGFTLSAALRRTEHVDQPELAGWEDKRATFQVGVMRALWKRTQLLVRFEHERNDSPVAGYDYARNWIAASVENWR